MPKRPLKGKASAALLRSLDKAQWQARQAFADREPDAYRQAVKLCKIIRRELRMRGLLY